MKKLILLLLVIVITVTIQAQKPFVLFGHAPKDLFASETVDRTIKASGTFLWSLDAVVSGAEITLQDNTFVTSLLSGVGGAVGYKFYKPLADGTPVSTWGVNLAVLTKVKINDIIDTRMKLALLANVYNFTAGPCFTFKDNKFSLLVGTSISF